MIKQNSLFVLGAAASPGFPLGSQLKLDVAKRLRFRVERGLIHLDSSQSRLHEATRRAGISDRRLIEIGNIISEGIGLASSIDNYMELRSADEDLVLCCKLAIADIILECESRITPLRTDTNRRLSVSDFESTWHQTFAQICFQSCITKAHVAEALSRFSVISFNYDRQFEQFLRVAIMRLFSVTYEEASDLAGNLVVLHPYGSLGTLPTRGKVALGFGQQSNLMIESIAKNIRTFTEQDIDHETLEKIKVASGNAITITFLGFGFHDPNLKIIEPPRTQTIRQVIGTCEGLAEFAQTDITQRLSHLFRAWANDHPLSEAKVRLESKKCEEFIDHNRLALVAKT